MQPPLVEPWVTAASQCIYINSWIQMVKRIIPKILSIVVWPRPDFLKEREGEMEGGMERVRD